MFPYWRLSSFYFFYFAVLGAWMPYWPLFLKEQGFDAQDIGYLVGIMMATKIFAPNLWGYLANITGQRMAIIRYGSLLAFVFFLGMFYSQNFWWLAFFIFTFSFFWNAVLAQFEVVTLSHLRFRFHRYSHIRVWGSVGFIITVALMGYLFDYITIAWLPWVLAVLLLCIWLSTLVVGERKRRSFSRQKKTSLMHILKQPSVVAFLSVCFLMQLSHGPYYAFFSVFLEQHGYSRTMTGLLWSLGVVAEVILFIYMHRVFKRFTLRQIMLGSLLLSVLRWFATGFFVDNLLILIVAQCLHAVSFGSFHVFAVEMVRRYFKGEHEGQGMALYSGLSYGAGGAIGAVLSGWVWATNPASTFVIAGVACILASLIALRIKFTD
jgi:PPP family 3-phenylpropionic acid transporter